VPQFRKVLGRILFYPASPRAYVACIFLLRALGILRRPAGKRNNPITKIFVSHPYARVGDLVLLLPLLERIRKRWPGASVDIAVGANVKELLLGVDGLNRMFVFNPSKSNVSEVPNRWRDLINTYLRLFYALVFYRQYIMQFDYDLAIVPRWGSLQTYEATYLAYLTGAGERYGYSADVDKGDTRIDALFTRVARGGEHEQEAVRNVKLLSRLGVVPENAEHAVANQTISSMLNLARIGVAEQCVQSSLPRGVSLAENYGVVSPGATARFRIWPTEQLSEVLEMLHQRYSMFFYIIGNKADEELCRDLEKRLPGFSISLSGKTNIKQMTALISQASLFVGNDSGAGHIAGALGIPCVIISPFPLSCGDEHPNSPVRFRPCGPLVRVVQPPKPLPPCNPTCGVRGEAHCIKQVSARDVFTAATVLITAGHGAQFTSREVKA
jgi:ADP-heptose:LPS heptosyltransferase